MKNPTKRQIREALEELYNDGKHTVACNWLFVKATSTNLSMISWTPGYDDYDSLLCFVEQVGCDLCGLGTQKID